MSLRSDSQVISNRSSEVIDRLERAEEEDAEDEEKAEHPDKFLALQTSSSESFMGPGRSKCVKCFGHVKGRCRHFNLRIRKFIQTDFYDGLKYMFLVSGFSFINRGSIRSPAGVAHERIRHNSIYPLMIHPFSLFRYFWDIGMSIAFVIILVLAPFHSTFYPEEYTKYKEWSKPFKISVIFFLDILINFRTGVVQTKTDIVSLDWRKIFVSYIKGWFFVDVVSSFPIDGLYLALVNSNNIHPEDQVALAFARIGVITRFLLLLRLLRYMRRIELSFKLNGLEIRLMNLVLTVTTFLHWLTCAHYLIPDLKNVGNVKKNKSSWVTELDLWNQTTHKKYITCFIRALSHLTLIGFGFEVPIEVEEIYVSVVNIVIGCIFMAQTLGYVLTLLMSLDVAERRFIEVTKQAQEYMRFKQIPKSLQARVASYFEQHYRRSFFSEQVVLSSVSNVLRRELLMHNCQTLVEEVPLFHSVNRTIVQEIVSRLEFEVYLPNDVIISSNTVGDCMYFIEHGTVSILSPAGRPICTLHDGDFFGEMSLVFNELRVATVIANTTCDIYRLDKADFAEVVQPYPDIYETIVKVAESRVSHLDKKNLYKHGKVAETVDKKENSKKAS